MEEKDLTVIQRIEAEIAKIDNKDSNIFFFVLDTKGNPSGSLEYIYKLAMILKENEYNAFLSEPLPENSLTEIKENVRMFLETFEKRYFAVITIDRSYTD